MKSFGFTLIELLLVLALIGILSFIAFPSYGKYLIKTRRIHMAATLSDIAGRMEKHYTIENTYDGTEERDSKHYSDYYLVDVLPEDGNYILVARPIGKQTEDIACGSLTLDQYGNRNSTGTGDSKQCWL